MKMKQKRAHLRCSKYIMIKDVYVVWKKELSLAIGERSWPKSHNRMTVFDEGGISSASFITWRSLVEVVLLEKWQEIMYTCNAETMNCPRSLLTSIFLEDEAVPSETMILSSSILLWPFGLILSPIPSESFFFQIIWTSLNILSFGHRRWPSFIYVEWPRRRDRLYKIPNMEVHPLEIDRMESHKIMHAGTISCPRFSR